MIYNTKLSEGSKVKSEALSLLQLHIRIMNKLLILHYIFQLKQI